MSTQTPVCVYVQAREKAKKGISAFKADVEEKVRKVRVLHAHVHADLRGKVALVSHPLTHGASECSGTLIRRAFVFDEREIIQRWGKNARALCCHAGLPLGIRLQFKLINGVL